MLFFERIGNTSNIINMQRDGKCFIGFVLFGHSISLDSCSQLGSQLGFLDGHFGCLGGFLGLGGFVGWWRSFFTNSPIHGHLLKNFPRGLGRRDWSLNEGWRVEQNRSWKNWVHHCQMQSFREMLRSRFFLSHNWEKIGHGVDQF